jgi:protein gp37
MAERSGIEWTDATWNPVTGCTKVSPGCKHCYAETLAERWRGVPGHPYEQGFDLRLWPDRLAHPLHWKRPRRIFVNSMSDLYHESVPDEFIDRVFDTMRRASRHQFQLLTKRTERMAADVARRNGSWGRLAEVCPHIWLGASVENRNYVHRAGIVAGLPSAVRFLSCEPLLGPLEIRSLLGPDLINWVIVGGESGPRARPMEPAWVESIRDQCREAEVAFFFKQWGGVRKGTTGRTIGGRTWDQYPAEGPRDKGVYAVAR